VDEDVFAAAILLDETETLVGVEELDCAFALANDLGGQTAATAAATAAAWAAEAAPTAAARAAEAAAATAAARAAAAEAVTAAKAIATATEAVTTTAKAIATASAAHERVETVFAKTVPLVPAPAATSSVKTHVTERTFNSPLSSSPGRADSRDKRHRKPTRRLHENLLCRIVHTLNN